MGQGVPDTVIEAVNNLIIKKLNGRSATFTQDEVIEEIISLYGAVTERQKDALRRQAFNARWLDFESLYQREGWHVVFDKPGYNESYKANWTFTVK